MALCIGHHGHIGHDERIHVRVGRGIDGAEPACRIGCQRLRVDRHQHLAAQPVSLLYGDLQLSGRKVEPGKVAGIGGIAQAEVDRIGTGFQRNVERAR